MNASDIAALPVVSKVDDSNPQQIKVWIKTAYLSTGQEVRWYSGLDAAAVALSELNNEYLDAKTWIGAHGSPRLRFLERAGIECYVTYRAERIALAFPGWVDYNNTANTYGSPDNAPALAVDALLAIRGKHPTSEIALATIGSKYVARSKYNGWDIYTILRHCPDVE